MMDDQQQRKHDSGNSKSSSNENCSNDNSYNQNEQQSYMDTVALYQQYTEQKKELSEEKRQMLRDIEVKAVKYMDDLESGRVESKSNLTIQQQVDKYRHKLFRDVNCFFRIILTFAGTKSSHLCRIKKKRVGLSISRKITN
jgi:hypothetical protein